MTLEDVRRRLESSDWQNRRTAVEELAALRNAIATTVPVLTDTLERDPNDSVRETAARVLGELKDPRDLAALTRLVRSMDECAGSCLRPGRLEHWRPRNPSPRRGPAGGEQGPSHGMGAAANALASIGPQASLIVALLPTEFAILVEQAQRRWGRGPRR
jgi:HEAT repeat protein